MSKNSSSTARIELEGEYDLSRRDEVAAVFGGLNGHPSVVIDFSKVRYMDSTVLHELAKLRFESAGRAVIIEGASGQVRRLLKLVGFDRIFNMAD
jgi:anti-anti-sigma factor